MERITRIKPEFLPPTVLVYIYLHVYQLFFTGYNNTDHQLTYEKLILGINQIDDWKLIVKRLSTL